MQKVRVTQAFSVVGILLATILSLPVRGHDFAGGSGTPEDPYQIATADQLIALGQDPSLRDKDFVLLADIECKEFAFTDAVIGDFSGTFDGDGHVIRNLRVTGYEDVGLFRRITESGLVINLGVVDVNIVGMISSGGKFTGYDAGGIAGMNRGMLCGCYVTGIVRGVSTVGGLIGRNYGIVMHSYCTGKVDGEEHVGGLVGSDDAGIISGCYSTAAVSGTRCVGGLVGNGGGVITNCWSAAAVAGTEAVGGLIGVHRGPILHCYSTGLVAGIKDVGGLVGRSFGPVLGSFWNIETSTQSESQGGIGLTTMQMQNVQTYLDEGWDLAGESGNGTADLWQMPVTAGYPVLSVFSGSIESVMEGQGTADNPYQIATAADLGSVARRDPRTCYKLTADIDLADSTWATAVIPVFAGSLDGNTHVIRHLRITGGRHLGLFGWVFQRGQIRHLGITDANLAGDGDRIGTLAGTFAGTAADCYSSGTVAGRVSTGALVGHNAGTITRCHAAGSVTGTGDAVGGLAGGNAGNIGHSHSTCTVNSTDEGAGGLVGNNAGCVVNCFSSGEVRSSAAGAGGLVGLHTGSLANSYSSGAVYGKGWVGGLVGDSRGRTTNCFSTSAVNGTGAVGGFAGRSNGDILNCYATGAVSATGSAVGGFAGGGDMGVITGCFWDVQTTGQANSVGGTGLTTAQMRSMATYADAGWDLAGRRQDGTSDIWFMPQAGGYPMLSVFDGDLSSLLAGQGTASEPYLLSTPEDLGLLAWDPLACYQLAADIDLSGISWPFAVVPAFGGVLDGNHHKLHHLTITGHHHVGLFGSTTGTARVERLNIVDANVTARGDHVGMLAGEGGGDIVGCSSTGSITGHDHVGGLVGTNNGRLTDCRSTATVKGRIHIGGLAGGNNATRTITRCYTDGAVTGSMVGGLAGSNDGTIADCNSVAQVDGESRAGGLVGESSWSIARSNSAGVVRSQYTAGGLVAINKKNITDCRSSAVISGVAEIGGLVGRNEGQTTGCHSTGAVSGTRDLGGLVGKNVKLARVTGCTSTGKVTATEYRVGGLVGLNEGVVTLSCSHSQVTGKSEIGGLIGSNTGSASSSFATGAASGQYYVGGLAGNNEGPLANCYSNGAASVSLDQGGGLVGINTYPITNCYSTGRVTGENCGLVDLVSPAGTAAGCFWDTTTSRQSSSVVGTGKSTYEMQRKSTFLMAGWNFTTVWTICEGEDYPRLQWENRPCPPQ